MLQVFEMVDRCLKSLFVIGALVLAEVVFSIEVDSGVLGFGSLWFIVEAYAGTVSDHLGYTS